MSLNCVDVSSTSRRTSGSASPIPTLSLSLSTTSVLLSILRSFPAPPPRSISIPPAEALRYEG